LGDPKDKRLQRSFLVKHFDEATSGIPVVKAIYIEVNCDPAQQDTEADYVLGLCRAPKSRMGGVVIGGSPTADAKERSFYGS
jgi:hypothetical protein